VSTPIQVRRQYQLESGCVLQLARGDLTTYRGDAIVNAANVSLLGGGGVDGAIHSAAGPNLLEACRSFPELSPGIRCPTGEARITSAGELEVAWVIHTVGPVYARAENPEDLLQNAHRNSLRLALNYGVRRIAFPAISCGVYGFPHTKASAIALQSCAQWSVGFSEICMVLFSASTWAAFSDYAENQWSTKRIP